jgi:uncharacterized protein
MKSLRPKKKSGRNCAKVNSLDAGIFSSWLLRTREILVSEIGADVPCGGCVGCCVSSQFIHIKPHETQTLSRIPKKLLFPAPLLPKGTMLLGYNDKGHCPMLIHGRCSIYEHRPLTCRAYDCRIFTAAGIAADDDAKGLINKQVRRWRFKYPTKNDKALHAAIKAASKFLKDNPHCFPKSKLPSNASQVAAAAIKVYAIFLDPAVSSRKTEMMARLLLSL